VDFVLIPFNAIFYESTVNNFQKLGLDLLRINAFCSSSTMKVSKNSEYFDYSEDSVKFKGLRYNKRPAAADT